MTFARKKRTFCQKKRDLFARKKKDLFTRKKKERTFCQKKKTFLPGKKKLARKMKVIRESNEIANEQLKNHGAK